MIVEDVLKQIKSLEPNMYSDDDLIEWIYQLECRIKTEIYDNYEHEPLYQEFKIVDDEGNVIEEGKSEIIDHSLDFLEINKDFPPQNKANQCYKLPLIAEYPYGRMYVSWLQAMIQLANAEYKRYNNSMLMFKSEFAAYRNWYNRTHTATKNNFKYF